jgi:hypothetical protein
MAAKTNNPPQIPAISPAVFAPLNDRFFNSAISALV